MKHPNTEQIMLLKEILDEVKDVKKVEKNNHLHLARHSKMINYAQTMLKTLWDERLLKDEESKKNTTQEIKDSKDQIKKLKKILIIIVASILASSIGINQVPEAWVKLLSLL